MDIIINFNKKRGISSQQAVTSVKHLFAAKKAGHAGTLDPIATGILLICLNQATKVARFLSELDKEYIVRLKLGESTDTYDSTGKLMSRNDISSMNLSFYEIEKVLNRFLGEIEQVPPMYSAIKIAGEPLYKLARKGKEIERRPRKVKIYSIDLLSFDSPYVEIRIACSKGTYMRSFCHDIGKMLGVGAHMVSLERIRIGQFKITEAVSEGDIQMKEEFHYSIDSALSHLQEIVVNEVSYKDAKNGLPLNIPPFYTSECFNSEHYVRLKSPDKRLFAIGKVEETKIKIERLLN